MTEEEMKQRVAEAEARAQKAEAEANDLKVQRSNQNSYITKLEGKVKGLETQMDTVKNAANTAPALAPEITEYFQKKRREDYTEQAYNQIKNSVTPDVFDLLKPEVDAFLKAYMNEQNVSVKYIVDAFHLLLGKAYADPNHAINKKAAAPASPVADPVTPSTNPVAIAEQIAKMQNRGMTNTDQPMNTPPMAEGPKVANTKEAMASFKTRLLNGFDSTKFE